jgi:hypothetical protein
MKLTGIMKIDLNDYNYLIITLMLIIGIISLYCFWISLKIEELYPLDTE